MINNIPEENTLILPAAEKGRENQETKS